MRHSDSKVWGLRLSSINLMPAAKDHMPCLLYKKVFFYANKLWRHDPFRI